MIFTKRSFYSAACFSALVFLGGELWADDAKSDQTVPEGVPASASADVPKKALPETPPKNVPEQNPLEAELKTLGEAIEELQKQRAEIEAKLALSAAKRDKELLPLALEKMALDAKRSQRAAAFSAKLAEIEEERAKLEREFALANARVNAKLREKQLRVSALEADSRELQMETAQLNAKLATPLAVAGKKQELAKIASAQPKYFKEPLINGALYISDRRIDFNGPVTPESAKRACELIHFYNNQDTEYPIFIVIDNSPGGSVLSGYQIQKAMQSSRAPVYVVVKGMAASMAAVLATTAERSYCFANTRILHHQISSANPRSNLTVMRENLAVAEEIYQIFIGPVAKKLGVSAETFTKQMYENNSEGDWEVFGTEAVERKWVDFLVERVEETSVLALKSDSGEKTQPQVNGIVEKTDATGTSYAELPMLTNPFDCWWIYDNSGYYRAR